jgi:hypothetical protein
MAHECRLGLLTSTRPSVCVCGGVGGGEVCVCMCVCVCVCVCERTCVYAWIGDTYIHTHTCMHADT